MVERVRVTLSRNAGKHIVLGDFISLDDYSTRITYSDKVVGKIVEINESPERIELILEIDAPTMIEKLRGSNRRARK